MIPEHRKTDQLYATHAVVDLKAIIDNLAGVRNRVGSRQIMMAVKADAYGHGAVAVSKAIQDAQAADWLAVATVPEGIELRQAGIVLPILKLSHAFKNEIAPALDHQITLPVVNEQTIAEVSTVAESLGTTARVHLAVDTGMRRIGAEPGKAVQLAQMITQQNNLELEGVFTHLPISDSAEGVNFTKDELARFRDVIDQIESAVGPIRHVHASNSGAILGHSFEQLTMVRPGIMGYGYYPDATSVQSVELKPAMSIYTKLSFIKQVRAEETVGYGRTWTAPNDTWIGTIPIGYADGFSRLNSNRGSVLIEGGRYPVAGRVCMDQTMINLGPEKPSFGVGARVTIMGVDGTEQITADDLAKIMGTISYEVTCLITPRVQRHYIG